LKSISKDDINLWINYFIVALGFTLPISIAINNILLVIILVLWLFSGDFQTKWKRIKQNQAGIAILLFFVLHLIAITYSSDPKTGLIKIISREQLLLFMLIILSVIQPKFVKKALSAFLYAMFLSEILSYGMFFNLIHLPWHNYAMEPFPTPFVSHLSYSPMAAFAVILLINRLIYDHGSTLRKIIYLFFTLTMSLNIFISGGRAGQIGFIVILFVYFVYQFRKEIKKMIIFLTMIATGILLVFFLNKSFHDRMMLAYHNVANFKTNPATSVGLRLNFAMNSIELIKEKPIFGYGTGSFAKEYERINQIKSPHLRSTSQPHNFYLLTLVQFGVLGLLFLFYIFYTLFNIAARIEDNYKGKRYVFLLLFLTIMLSDSYLLGHYTTLFFAYMSGLLFGGTIEESTV
jgi:O-antigen ligase